MTGRAPSGGKQQVLRDSLDYHLDYFSGKRDGVKAFLNQGEAPTD